MHLTEDLPPLGGEPIAAVFGGIFALALSTLALVLFRERLRNGPRLSPRTWTILGAAGGGLLYASGLVALGRGHDLADPTALLAGVPWALALTMTAGALVGYSAGGRVQWHPAGVAVLGAMILAAVGWGSYLLTTRLPAAFAHPDLVGLALLGLLFLQLLALVIVSIVACYMLDGLVRRAWTREPHHMRHDPEHRPVVAIHVASYNEPPEIVERTLDSLVAQDYPRERLHIILADDSTDAESIERLRAACEARGVVFMHREERRGYKAGALNDALRITPPEAEVIAIVDADFVVEPGFVRENVGYFADPSLAFLQSKLWFSNMDESFTARGATLMEHFFYTSMMRTRNEGNSILFCGTMGMLRRAAIEEVGGWTDGHVGEDVDLSCRMLAAGWTSLYVPKVYGHGIQTVDQESFRKQQARWAYGGARILRDHGLTILRSRMTLRQKLHHLYPPFYWLDGLLALVFAAGTLFFAAAFLTGNVGWIPVHDLVFVGLVPVMIMLENMLRAGFTMRRLMGIGFRDVAGMIILGWSGKLQNSISAAAALLGLKRPFSRTPKLPPEALSRTAAARQAVRVAPAESVIGAALAAASLAMVVKLALVGSGPMPLLLVAAAAFMSTVWAMYFSAAPVCVYLGHVSRRDRTTRPKGLPVAAAPRSPA